MSLVEATRNALGRVPQGLTADELVNQLRREAPQRARLDRATLERLVLRRFPSDFLFDASSGHWRTWSGRALQQAEDQLEGRLPPNPSPHPLTPPSACPVLVSDDTRRGAVVYLDFETAGLDPATASVLEVGGLRIAPDGVREEYTALIYHPRDAALSERALAVSGITREELVEGRPEHEVAADLARLLQSALVIAHNGDAFDFVVLDRLLTRHSLRHDGPRADSLHLAQLILPRVRHRTLTELAENLDVVVGTAHRALADVLTTVEIVAKLIEVYRGWPAGRRRLVRAALEGTGWPFLSLLPSELEGSPGPLGFLTVDDLPDALLPVEKEPLPPTHRPFGPEMVAAAFGPGGQIERAARDAEVSFEPRAPQRSYAAYVAQTLTEGRIALVEAGTGVGKTKGYLYPALEFARTQGRQVLLSTHTRSLQDQLHDELQVASRLNAYFGLWRAEVLKGTANYLCLQKLDDAFAELRKMPPDPDDPADVARRFSLALIASWAAETPYGFFEDLRAHAWAGACRRRGFDFAMLLAHLGAGDGECASGRCRFAERCPYRRAAARARTADFVVVNHALLLAQGRHVPPLCHVICDEAHTLEGVATEAFSVMVTGREILTTLTGIHGGSGRNATGLFARLVDAFGSPARALVRELGLPEVERARAACEAAGRQIETFLAIYDRQPLEHARYGHTYEIQPSNRRRRVWVQVEQSVRTLTRALTEATDALNRLGPLVHGLPVVDPYYRREALERQLIAHARECADLAERVDRLLRAEEVEEYVYTVETAPLDPENEDGPSVWGLRAQPIDVAPLLRLGLWDEVESAVLTSATLRVAHSFQFIRNRLGLQPELASGRLLEARVDSDFPYAERVLLALPDHLGVPGDLPVPRQALLPEFVQRLSAALAVFVPFVGGRTLGLFTSQIRLDEVARRVAPALQAAGLTVYAPERPGSREEELPGLVRASRMAIRDDFRQPGQTGLLLGLRSFWEGLDVPGDALQYVWIEKLPFPNFGTPLIRARRDRVREAGGDEFLDYYLPLMILPFVQGFGRLMRTPTDKGVGLVADRRLRSAYYRHHVLQSLPETRKTEASGAALYQQIRTFMGEEFRGPDGEALPVPEGLDVDRLLEVYALRPEDDSSIRLARLREVAGLLFPKIRALHSYQEQAMGACLEGRDVVVVLPTGAGKSLIYQLPALLRTDGITIVVSPLVSLMKDQVDKLRHAMVGLPVRALNSSLSGSERREVYADLEAGRCRLLYLSPERLRDPRLQEILPRLQVAQLVVDEAHCISLWGHQFRPEFLHIGAFTRGLGPRRPPILALTATATPEVRADIERELGLVDPVFLTTSVNRHNLRYAVCRAASRTHKDELLVRILTGIVDRGEPGSFIVYCARQRDTERLASLLEATCGIQVAAYHGGMELGLRAHIQEAFMEETGGLRGVVATKAFGMGVDKQDVRYVIHYDLPASLEDYAQESGRAGRDGKPAWCVLLFRDRDRSLHDRFIADSVPQPAVLAELYERLVHLPKDVVSGSVYAQPSRLAAELGVEPTVVRVRLWWLERLGCVRRAPADALVSGRLHVTVPMVEVLIALEGCEPEDAALGRRLFEEKLGLGDYDSRPIDLFALAKALGTTPHRLQRILLHLEEANVVALHGGEPAIVLDLLHAPGGATATEVARLGHIAEERLRHMIAWARLRRCRRAALLEYFQAGPVQDGGSTPAPARCGTCDRCVPDLEAPWTSLTPEDLPDLSQAYHVAGTMLDLVAWSNGRYTFKQMIRTLKGENEVTGSGGQRWKLPATLFASDFFGRLRHVRRREIETTGDRLLETGLIALESQTAPRGDYTYQVPVLTELGRQNREQRTTVEVGR